ncbi:DsbA family oxidoreductase [Lascolabacillus massiliensis]|uniref:DsbA family oxidoreductase n=1 Tax=Lascolabacillus massiliensis TaxID=1627894 RepID=UPI0006B3C249|nr:DsbA family oxidoreductase [Lascolabacillus massiliensis]
MKIEIWSDVMCPFCYIGKRNFETALEQFSNKNGIEVEWKSFQLDPSLPEVQDSNYTDYLMVSKGLGRPQVEGMLNNVTQMAKGVGLEYDFDRAVMVNSFKAHRVLQLAKMRGLGDAAEERLFRAFFTEGRNIADDDTLLELGKEAGLNETEIRSSLSDERYSDMVRQDIQEARAIGVTGVPFFVFNRKYAVSGAQPPQAFLQTLEKAYEEWREANPEIKIEVTKGQSCSIDGVCD